MTISGPGAPGIASPSARPADNPKMMSLARDLEAGFLAEMLKSAGLDQAREALGGGEGESQFSSFLLHEHAKAIVAAGGIGLSEAIYTSLVRKEARE